MVKNTRLFVIAAAFAASLVVGLWLMLGALCKSAQNFDPSDMK